MTSSFNKNQVQAIFGRFKPVLNLTTSSFNKNQVQAIFGRFKPVLSRQRKLFDLVGKGLKTRSTIKRR